MDLKQLKKAERKQKRFHQTVLKQLKIEASTDPTKVIAICNAGQATGLTFDGILSCAGEFISRQDVKNCILPNGMSYGFLEFLNVDRSTVFYNNVHGISLIRPDNADGPFFLSYIQSVPRTTDEKSVIVPAGLAVIDNFITTEEEATLLNEFGWESSESGGALKQREVSHYGYEFRYGSNDVDKDQPLNKKIPDACDFLWQRLQENGLPFTGPPDQLTVNKYKPGQGIPPHVDTHSPFGPILYAVSLGAPVIMDWKHWSGRKASIDVPNRSILLMSGEARYDWLHGIASRTWDPVDGFAADGKRFRGMRISLTFRWTSSPPCQCDYPKLCDRENYLPEKDRDSNDIASTLEEIHVHQVYEDIAPHFSVTRHKPWPRVVGFVKELKSGSILLDLGAGNGKNISMRSDLVQIALERSSGLLNICREHCSTAGPSDCIRGDALAVPLQDSTADAIICIAVLHHFANEERRTRAIAEIVRLLRKGGTALITVWARDQGGASYLKESNGNSPEGNSEILVLPGVRLPIHENRTQFKQGDLLVPWKLRKPKESGKLGDQESTLLRYYHVFEQGELDHICLNIPELSIVDSFYEQGNWCIIINKT